MDIRFAHRPPRRGFTLVEMLVVIVIIGILTGLITGAAIMARNAARRTAIVTEIHDMELALGAYKEKLGDYPPDFTDQDAFLRHLARAFPRYVPTSTNPTKYGNNYPAWQNDLAVALGLKIDNQTTFKQQLALLDPSTALVFWLAGVPDANGIPNGFSANPSDPFDYIGIKNGTPTPSRIGPFFEFDRKRFVFADGTRTVTTLFRYIPNNGNADSEPYLYFRPNYYLANAWANNNYEDPSTHRPKAKIWPLDENGNPMNGRPIVMPYWDAILAGTMVWTKPEAFWVNPTKFQILCPGLDGKYWSGSNPQPGHAFPIGSDYISEQYDDITNFSGGTLKDKMP